MDLFKFGLLHGEFLHGGYLSILEWVALGAVIYCAPGKHKTNTHFPGDLFQVAAPMKAAIHLILPDDVPHADPVSYGNFRIVFAL